MTGWIIALVVSVVTAGFVLSRVRARRESSFELGHVSQSWITAQSAGERDQL
jgi:hypothetical protein